MNEAIPAIEALLGQPVGKPGAVTSLNAVAPSIIDNARRLQTIHRHIYLRHVVAPSEHKWIGQFAEDCVTGQANVERWRRGVIVALWPDYLLGEPLAKGLERLSALSDAPLEIRSASDSAREMAGAPVARLPDADYHWSDEPEMRSYAWGSVETQQTDDLEIAGRRWLANFFQFRNPLKDVVDPDPIAALRAIDPDVATFSKDARIAMAAYLELRATHPDARALGAVGPDSLFSD